MRDGFCEELDAVDVPSSGFGSSDLKTVPATVISNFVVVLVRGSDNVADYDMDADVAGFVHETKRVINSNLTPPNFRVRDSVSSMGYRINGVSGTKVRETVVSPVDFISGTGVLVVVSCGNDENHKATISLFPKKVAVREVRIGLILVVRREHGCTFMRGVIAVVLWDAINRFTT